ncbi:Calcium-binding protein 39-like protein [Thelohanellus kitauei]|uniref:Calcium-binding protein 39-like protein n=1 Tax=Thelohanellus kitauei TaxID=669202 RepID=A0A0C2N2X4_THEKT|nr:Calcium-binding protein 39-like protein [Thelohanellus kitauei]
MPFFSHKKSSPEEIVTEAVDQLKDLLANKSKPSDKNKAETTADAAIGTLNSKLNDANTSFDAVAQLCHLIYTHDLILLLVKSLPLVGFETRKDITNIMGFLVRRQVGSSMPTVEYIVDKANETVFELLKMFENRDCSQAVGLMLRDMAKFPPICQIMLSSPHFFDFFRLIVHPIFDIATDCFLTFHVEFYNKTGYTVAASPALC